MQIKRMMEETSSKGDFESDKKLRMYYQSCSNETLREEQGVRPLQRMLERLGGWPVLEGSAWKHEGSFKWYNHVLKMETIGYLEQARNGIDNYDIQRTVLGRS